MKGKKILVLAAVAAALLVAVPALATSWDLASSFSTAGGYNNQWITGYTSYLEHYSSEYVMPAYLAHNGVNSLYSGSTTVYTSGGALGTLYNSGTEDATVQAISNYNTLDGTLHAGELALSTDGGNEKATARWRASVDGDYSYSVTWRTIADARNGYFIATGWGGDSDHGWNPPGEYKTYLTSGFFTTDGQTVTLTGTQHVLAGGFLDFGLTPFGTDGFNYYWPDRGSRDQAVALNVVVSDASVPEPGSMMALATGLAGLIGFGIRRKKA
jgi:hypothetical protein